MTETQKPKPTCPACHGSKYRREVVRLYDEKAMQKKPLVMLTCTKCSHALIFNGMSNLFDIG
jgi:hypothetical protein